MLKIEEKNTLLSSFLNKVLELTCEKPQEQYYEVKINHQLEVY